MRSAVILSLCALSLAKPAVAQGIIGEWSSVVPPPAPKLEQVTLQPDTTALLLLDFAPQTCGMPRCRAMLPTVTKLLSEARAKHWTVIYTEGAASKPAEILPEVARHAEEPLVVGPPDKFIGSGLQSLLRQRHIRTVVTVGAAAEGAVLHTAASAAFRGFDVVVPVDAMASTTLYGEQYTAWDLVNAPRVSDRAKLSAVDLLK